MTSQTGESAPAPGPLGALLLLGDGRLPTGGYAHSGGVETAVARGLLQTTDDLEALLTGRLWTTGAVAATLAAAACRALLTAYDAEPAPGATPGNVPAAAATGLPGALARLDAEADARTPSPAQRAASRAQGRALLRLAHRAWPHPGLDALGPTPHQALALGVTAAAAGLGDGAAALLAASASVAGPATTAVRLLGLDPLEVAAVQARLAGQVAAVAARGTSEPRWSPGAPLLDLLAEEHAAAGVPLFAS